MVARFLKAIRLSAMLLPVAALAGMTACTVYPRWVPEGPTAYRDGYCDGCRTGALARWGSAGFRHIGRKHQKSYRENPEYREGWDEARVYCEQNPVIAPYFNEPDVPGGGTTGGIGAGK